MAEATTLLRLAGADLGYGSTRILRDVDLEIRRGELFALIGKNGSGKSTLLAALLGTHPPLFGERSGEVEVGFVPQRGELDPVFPFLAREVVGMGLLGGHAIPRKERPGAIREALSIAGLLDQAEAPFRDLSGGQRQRALIARALVSRPELLILDEPTNDLDVEGQAEVEGLILDLHREGRTLVFVSHALDLVQRTAQRVGVLRGDSLSIVEPERLDDPRERARLLGLDPGRRGDRAPDREGPA